MLEEWKRRVEEELSFIRSHELRGGNPGPKAYFRIKSVDEYGDEHDLVCSFSRDPWLEVLRGEMVLDTENRRGIIAWLYRRKTRPEKWEDCVREASYHFRKTCRHKIKEGGLL